MLKNPLDNIDSAQENTMAQRLKRWESPRRKGRNDKGHGGSARARQLAKRQQQLRRRLKANETDNTEKDRGGDNASPSFCPSFEIAA